MVELFTKTLKLSHGVVLGSQVVLSTSCTFYVGQFARHSKVAPWIKCLKLEEISQSERHCLVAAIANAEAQFVTHDLVAFVLRASVKPAQDSMQVAVATSTRFEVH